MTRDPVELLRKYLEVPALFSERNGYKPFDREPALRMLDEIEVQYMKLPMDADGVPIRLGDFLQLGDEKSEVVSLAFTDSGWEWECVHGDYHAPMFARHVKPDTVESLLEEFLLAMADATDQPDIEAAERRAVAEYAERIRRLQ
jgi:hypothetical protein